MAAIELQQVAEQLPGSELRGNCSFKSVSTDTRSINAGDLFVAIKGDKFDAHNFLEQAVKQQAAGLLVERARDDLSVPQLVVADSVQALGSVARLNRDHFLGPVVGITGSGGKTTVKNMVSNILALSGSVCATQGNFNNAIGVPLTLFQINPEHQYAVIEMGASGPGEIAYLSQIVKPHVAVVTNALHAHVAGFGSVEGVAKAKGEIFTNLSDTGTAVLNVDDPQVDVWLEMVGARKKLTFSLAGKHADFVARDIDVRGNGCCQFLLIAPMGEASINLALLGKQNVGNALAAAACAYAIGIGLEQIKQGLENTLAFKGRMQVHTGIANSTVIDDSYNANPDAVKAAIDYLADQTGKTILVLGDLGELGADEVQYHKGLGYYAKSAGIHQLFTKGNLTLHTSEAFGEGAQHFQTYEQMNDHLLSIVDADTKVLVKGSRSSHMEHVVSALIKSEET